MIQFPCNVIGLMSGTSADGVDAAILRTNGRDMVEAGESLFVPYSDGLRADILALMRGAGDEGAVAKALTDVHILAVKELLKKSVTKADLVGFHGQTIRHAPHEGITHQIGEPARMARELSIPVVADFRSNDVRNGGQGAPLVPLYHAALARDLPKPLMVVNIGGVSNVTWIGESGEAGAPLPAGEAGFLNERSEFRNPGEGVFEHALSRPHPDLQPHHISSRTAPSLRDEPRDVVGANPTSPAGRGAPVAQFQENFNNIVAFDCGPGNALMDDWVHRHTGKRYDADGQIAAMGVIDSAAVSMFLRDPYFLKDAPKSLDRLHFSRVIDALISEHRWSVEDGAATLSSMTACAIALSFGCVPAPPKQVLICGGGRKNGFLMGLLKACVNAPVMPVEEVGWDGDMLEAQAFAYLAARSVQGLPLSLPTTTGVREPVSGGKFFAVSGE